MELEFTQLFFFLIYTKWLYITKIISGAMAL